MIGFEIDWQPGRSPRRHVQRLEGIGRRAGDARPALEKIRRSFYAAERARFSSDGQGQWQPLTTRYTAVKARKGLDPRILRATGELQRALTTGRGTGAVNEVTSTAATLGTDLPRAVYAQRGSGRRRRRVLVITRPRRARWTRIIHDHLVGGGGS